MINILFNNNDILAIDKPYGIASIPERDLAKETVLSILEKKVGQKLFVVHRLDKEVSGVMLFAKSAGAHRHLNKGFFERTISKTYRALVLGQVQVEKGTIDKPIRQFGSGRMGIDEAKGKPCQTMFDVLQRFDDTTLLDAFPVTGRRHQIRVHLYSIGHPVAGDLMYGDKNLQKKYPRLMLHARKIRFSDTAGKEIVVESEIPQEFIR